MKKLLLLLFIPLISFGQITFKDVMSISSQDQFKRVMIENNYEFDSIDEDGDLIYGVDIVKDSREGNESTSWAWHNETGNGWGVSFTRKTILSEFLGTNPDTSENSYDLIVSEIKEKCKFYKIITSEISKVDYSCYSCTSSTYKGKIGFTVKEGWGYIMHFPEE